MSTREERAELLEELHDLIKGASPLEATQHQIQEIFDRSKRLETRLTNFLIEAGYTVNVVKPVWKLQPFQTPAGVFASHVEVASLRCALGDVLDAMPPGVGGPIPVTHKGQLLTVVSR